MIFFIWNLRWSHQSSILWLNCGPYKVVHNEEENCKPCRGGFKFKSPHLKILKE